MELNKLAMEKENSRQKKYHYTRLEEKKKT
jgi:hypothetical protein